MFENVTKISFPRHLRASSRRVGNPRAHVVKHQAPRTMNFRVLTLCVLLLCVLTLRVIHLFVLPLHDIMGHSPRANIDGAPPLHAHVA